MGQATWNPALVSLRDEARLRLGDTNAEHALRDDATYDALITKYGLNTAVVVLAQGLVAEYGQLPVRVDENGVTLDFSERLRAWQYIVTQAQTAPPEPVTVTATVAAVGPSSVLMPVRARRWPL